MSKSSLLRQIKEWFDAYGLNHAVVGFSGGIDSAVTAALCAEAGIPTTIVLATVDGQTRSSNYNTRKFAALYSNMDVKKVFFNLDMLYSNASKEAALPIMRNAFFYAVAAELRVLGKNSVCVGTCNFDEAAYLGFWGKASDAAQDFYPISHLHKSEVYKLAKELNVPQEIIDAEPSGDLQWSGDLNDFKMIGATYDDVETIATMAEQYHDGSMLSHIEKLPNPEVFVANVLRNRFKYEIPFGQKHLSNRLEQFRLNYYPIVLELCEKYHYLAADRN